MCRGCGNFGFRATFSRMARVAWYKAVMKMRVNHIGIAESSIFKLFFSCGGGVLGWFMAGWKAPLAFLSEGEEIGIPSSSPFRFTQHCNYASMGTLPDPWAVLSP